MQPRLSSGISGWMNTTLILVEQSGKTASPGVCLSEERELREGTRRKAEWNGREDRDDVWRHPGPQGCTVNTGRKMPRYHRRHVDVCSSLCASCCWAESWRQPLGALDKKVKEERITSPTSCVSERRGSVHRHHTVITAMLTVIAVKLFLDLGTRWEPWLWGASQ